MYAKWILTKLVQSIETLLEGPLFELTFGMNMISRSQIRFCPQIVTHLLNLSISFFQLILVIYTSTAKNNQIYGTLSVTSPNMPISG